MSNHSYQADRVISSDAHSTYTDHTNTLAMIFPTGTTHAGCYATFTTCTTCTIRGTALPMGLGRTKSLAEAAEIADQVWGSPGRLDGCGCRTVFTISRTGRRLLIKQVRLAAGSAPPRRDGGLLHPDMANRCMPPAGCPFERLGLAYAGHEGLGPASGPWRTRSRAGGP